jgi:hypothetical protein
MACLDRLGLECRGLEIPSPVRAYVELDVVFHLICNMWPKYRNQGVAQRCL